MKKFSSRIPILVLAAGLSTSTAAIAEKAYEGVTENVSAKTTSRIYSDGKGHMRSETNLGGVNRVSIMDFNAKVSYSIDDANKTIMKMPLSPPPDQDPKTQWTPIPGVKVIDGHPCSGKRATVNGTAMEVWTGNDTGCSVLVTSNGNPVMKLKSWSAGNPNPALFSLPTGYKTMDMSELMRGMQAGGQR